LLGKQNPCRNLGVLRIDGKLQNISIDAQCTSGNLYLEFRTVPENDNLAAGDWPYLYVPVPEIGAIRRQFSLYITLQQVIEDSPTTLLHRPVIRGSTQALATVEVQGPR
jgi:hypothetical protein